MGLAATGLVTLSFVAPSSLLAQPNSENVDNISAQHREQIDSQLVVAQASSDQAQGARSKVEEVAEKKEKPSAYQTVGKPDLFVLLEQATTWTFPGTGAAWGTGAALGGTFVGFGVSGTVKGSRDNLLSWSAQLGPLFQHTYNVPGRDQTPLRMDVSAYLSPLIGDDLNIYAIWRGVAGIDVADQRRFANTVRIGILYSFAKSSIIPDVIEQINLPERGFYTRVQPSWTFQPSGQLVQVETQVYLGLSETWYPFTFAFEIGPQFIQGFKRELQTTLGSFFDFGYVINARTRAFARYRPAISFGGNAYPAATQAFQAGVSYNF